MISEGRVEVNGTVVTEQGVRVDPDRRSARRIQDPAAALRSYLVLNKHAASFQRCPIRRVGDPGGSPIAGSGSSTSVGSILDTEGLLIRRTTETSRTVWRTRHTRSPRRTSPKSPVASPATIKQLRGVSYSTTAGAADFRQGGVHRCRPNSDQDHAARGSAAHRPPYDGCGRPPSAAPLADRHRARSARRLKVGEMRDLTREELGELLDLTSEPT